MEKVRDKLKEIGVDTALLEFIDKLTPAEQEGVYHFFLEIMNDELLFVLALKDQDFSENYLRNKEKNQPMALN